MPKKLQSHSHDELGKAVLNCDGWSQDEQQAAMRNLKSSRRVVTLWTIILAVLCVLSISLQFASPVYHWLCTKNPEKIEFLNLSYLDPNSVQTLFRESPFMEAITIFLKDEGKASGLDTRLIIGATKPLPNPSHDFSFSISIEDDTYELSGYAFRQHKDQGETLYQSVELNYLAKNSIVFSVPACEGGNAILFVARLSRLKGQGSFPSKPELILTTKMIPKGDQS